RRASRRSWTSEGRTLSGRKHEAHDGSRGRDVTVGLHRGAGADRVPRAATDVLTPASGVLASAAGTGVRGPAAGVPAAAGAGVVVLGAGRRGLLGGGLRAADRRPRAHRRPLGAAADAVGAAAALALGGRRLGRRVLGLE